MLAGTVTTADLPEAFDAKLREYLGVQPADVVEGVLQDVHWSDSSFGYFPTYALGNVISRRSCGSGRSGELGDLDAQFERGEFGRCASGCGENVHRLGPQPSSRRSCSSASWAGRSTRSRTSRYLRAEARGARAG